jgi:H2-forming N5,N10-methylenetetrahydromethanopterin dehydrogenase-like enzyme
VLVSACGGSSSTSSTAPTTTVNTAQVARSIEGTVLEKRHVHVTAVCPAAVPAEKGKTFECIATGRGTKPPHAVTKTPFLVTIQSDRGYVTYAGK